LGSSARCGGNNDTRAEKPSLYRPSANAFAFMKWDLGRGHQYGSGVPGFRLYRDLCGYVRPSRLDERQDLV